MEKGRIYSIDISFEEISLPSFRDILVLAKNGVQGKRGLQKSLDLLAPANFTVIDVNEGTVEAIFVNTRLLAKIPEEKIVQVLRNNVFPCIAEGELIQVDFKVRIMLNNISG